MVGLKAGADDARVHKLIGVAPPVGSRDMSFLATITKPKLIISGDRDHICPLPALQKLLAADPGCLAIVPGADHFFGGEIGCGRFGGTVRSVVSLDLRIATKSARKDSADA